MIQQVNGVYELYCDKCKGLFILRSVDPLYVRRVAENSNWQITQDSDLCPDCWNDSSLEVEDGTND